MIYIMNTSILTGFGSYDYEPISLESVIERMTDNQTLSAIGHESTADVITTLTGITVKMNRISVDMQIGDSAIVFKLDARPPEGAILDQKELERIGFSWGLITRTK